MANWTTSKRSDQRPRRPGLLSLREKVKMEELRNQQINCSKNFMTIHTANCGTAKLMWSG
jgi:hypothetical protein